MPANLTPDYRAAEQAYRRARDPRARLDALREMLRTIPKHKGTDHLQADIKSRIRELSDELGGPSQTGARGGPPTVVRPEGAAQVALVGPPNAGKSALHSRLTGSHSEPQPYPFATQYPAPGMMPVEDVLLQLIDLPSISPSHPIGWIGNALQPADAALLVVDLSQPGCVEQVADLHRVLAGRKVVLDPGWPLDGVVEHEDPFTKVLPTALLATKADLLEDPDGELEVFLELTGYRYPAFLVSAETGRSLDDVGRFVFRGLEIVRVYTRAPGRDDDGRPFTIRRGETVEDVARLVHKEVAAGFRYARLWGAGDFDGQQVGREHPLEDGDVIEIHT
jgi:ribosome-interacting GTPase 1